MEARRLSRMPEGWGWGTGAGLFLFAGLAALECLLPLAEVTDTGEVQVFWFAFLCFFALDVWAIPALLRGSLKAAVGTAALFAALYLPLDYPLIDPVWVQQTGMDMREGWHALFDFGIPADAPGFRTALFLLLLAGAARLTFFLAFQRGNLFPVWVGVLVYLSVLDSFTPFDGGGPVVRVFIWGCLLLSWFRLRQLTARTHGDPPRPRGWVFLTLALVVGAAVVGWSFPKADASWPDPVAFLQSWDDRAGGAGVGKIGYGNNDARLGGPFRQDKSVVMSATTTIPWYWRGESKDFYTGKGWQNTLKAEAVDTASLWEGRRGKSTPLPADLFDGLPKEESVSRLEWRKGYPVLFTAGQLRTFFVPDPEPSLHPFESDPDHGGFRQKNGRDLWRYTTLTDIPRIDKKALRRSGDSYPADISRSYLQLPDNLPRRVKEKALELTEGADNPYEKAVRIEQHLKLTGGYRYEHKDVSVPDRQTDFVDQFLFDTRLGYCDHFSTSMTVMLRSIGIPARWVKGFAPGESSLTEQERAVHGAAKNVKLPHQYQVTVRNSDAHSWVEVYFAGKGWIPFEPTPGFNNPTPVKTEESDSPAGDGEEDDASGGDRDRIDRAERELAATAPGTDGGDGGTFDWKPWAWGAGAAVLTLGVVSWLIRRRIAWWWNFRRGGSHGESGSLLTAFGAVLGWLRWSKGPRRPDQTVREYVLEEDWLLRPSRELRELTRLYERERYGGEADRPGWSESVRRLWAKAMRQLRP